MSTQRGFGMIAAIVVLVALAALAGAIASLSTTTQVGAAQDVQAARAWQAARAGNEYGLYLALQNQSWGAGTCDTGNRTTTLNLVADTGFNVTVTCQSYPYNEGETAPGVAQAIRIYQIRAVACPSATCPDASAAAAGLGYIERSRMVIASG
jgi:MSHA biogenesis protein MshP